MFVPQMTCTAGLHAVSPRNETGVHASCRGTPAGGSPLVRREVATSWGAVSCRHSYAFPYLIDATQEVAKAYRAACTPDFFVFDAELRLVYRGQFDDSRPKNDTPVTGRDLRAAVDTVLAGQAPTGEQEPSIGCNIKWKPGSEPDYFG